MGGNLGRSENTGGTWTHQERRMFINELELFALKLALETFFKAQGIESLHIQTDNIVDLTYFLKRVGKNFTNGLSFQTNLGTAINI